MLSNFQVMRSVWLPEFLTRAFAAKVKTRFEMLHTDASAAHDPTGTAVRARIPAVPAPAGARGDAVQLPLVAAEVAEPATDGVNAATLASTEIFSVLAAVARTIWSIATLV